MKKILSIIVPISFACMLFMSCHDVIFDTIRDEVKLEEAQVSGDINSIIRYTMNEKEYLFADNGNIWYKNVDAAANGTPTESGTYSGGWLLATEFGIAANHIVKLAADSTHLYALGVKIEANNDSGDMEATAKILYTSTDGNNWTAVTVGESELLPTYYRSNLFCTNSVKNENRYAYINVAGTIYQLSGGTATEIATGETNLTTTPTANSYNCIYFNGAVYFSNAAALVTNETKDSEATVLYYNYGGYLYYRRTSDEDGTLVLATDTLYDIAYTADYLLLGTSDGLQFVSHTDAIPATVVDDSLANASSTLSSYYEIYNIIAVDPAQNTLSGDIYGTTTFSGSTSSTGATNDNVGLWAYYPGRGNWNRE